MNAEIWKDVVGLEEYYQVSNKGRVMSKDRMVNNRNGKFIRKSIILKFNTNSKGYLRVPLSDGNVKKNMLVHRLVAIAFIPNLKNYSEVNHMDSNYLNNSLENLEWVTHTGNMHHAINKGRFNNSFSKTLDKFKESRELVQRKVIGINIKTGEVLKFNTINEAGRVFNNAGGICNCCKGKAKTSKGYTWSYAS